MAKKRIESRRIVHGFLYLITISISVFLRRDFGVRMRGDLLIAAGVLWICFWFYGHLTILITSLPKAPLAPVFLFATVGMSLYHYAATFFRRGNRAEVHSFSTGRPFGLWLLFGCHELTTQRYVQPIVCLVFGIVVYRFDVFVCSWMMSGAFGLLIEGQVYHARLKTRVLDAIDSRIEGKILHAAMQQYTSAPKRRGVAPAATVVIAEPEETTKPRLSEIFARVNPKLRQALDPPVAPQSDHQNDLPL